MLTVLCHLHPFHVLSVAWACWSEVAGGKDLTDLRVVTWMQERSIICCGLLNRSKGSAPLLPAAESSALPLCMLESYWESCCVACTEAELISLWCDTVVLSFAMPFSGILIWDVIISSLMFLVKHKEEQWSHQISGICDLVVMKLMHQSDSVAVAAVLNEVSQCWSEICDEILLFLCFIPHCGCLQVYVLPKRE